jgi:hypothetical protein
LEPLIPAGTEDRRERGRRLWVGASLLVFALMSGALALIAVAYVQQSDEVDALEEQNEAILGEHDVIGKAFAQHAEKLARTSKRLESALRESYGQGFLAGQQAAQLPRALRPLARHAALGLSVPRRVPTAVADAKPQIRTGVDGYDVRWRGLALFASRSDPLSIWTRQALAGSVATQRIGTHRVRRLIGPNGVIYAWSKGGSTYGVIAVPRLESAGRQLVTSMS